MKIKLMSLLFTSLTTLCLGAAFEGPVMLTSAGQSADVQMAKALMKKANIQFENNNVIQAEDLGATKTLIVTVGGSSKGLGAAGIKVEDEIERVESLLKTAKEKGIKIIGLHIGGAARRGGMSDKFLDATIPNVDKIIVVEDGNKDEIFTEIAKNKNIEIEIVPKITNVVEPLKKSFN